MEGGKQGFPLGIVGSEVALVVYGSTVLPSLWYTIFVLSLSLLLIKYTPIMFYC